MDTGPVKGLYLMVRRPDLDRQAFSRYWADNHAALAHELPGVRRYVQSHRIDVPDVLEPLQRRCPFDGVAELWADAPGDFEAMRSSRAYRERLVPDEAHFVDAAGTRWLTTRPRVALSRPGDGGVKLVFLVRRHPDLTVDEFREHWVGVHAPLVADTPGLVRYVQCMVLHDAHVGPRPRFDGVAELSWDTVDALREGIASHAFREVQARDAARFLDVSTLAAMVAVERRFIWPADGEA